MDGIGPKFHWEGLFHPSVVPSAEGLSNDVLLVVGELIGSIRLGCLGIVRLPPGPLRLAAEHPQAPMTTTYVPPHRLTLT
mmetsp:Transcript_60258/g.140940  ORF Transcript_60258/g.140940 Transcript_60258/m.140940 type:complete len:80 (+) Transcript_60258:1190-1429(+)